MPEKTGIAGLIRQAGQEAKREVAKAKLPAAGDYAKSSDNIFSILEYIESDWGLAMRLFPAQRFIVKLYYFLELDDELPEEDYLRILRALRFASRFGFGIAPETWEALRAAAPGLAGLSAERVRDEWIKGLQTARHVGEFVRLWHDAGAAAVVLPELRPEPIPMGADDPPRDPILLTALLVRNPDAVLARLRGSNAEVARVARMVAGPPRPPSLEPVAVRRWMARVGAAVDDLTRAHQMQTGEAAPWLPVVEEIRERGDPLDRGALAIGGNDLVAAGVARGPAIGRVLEQLLDEVLDDPARNTADHLLARARELA